MDVTILLAVISLSISVFGGLGVFGTVLAFFFTLRKDVKDLVAGMAQSSKKDEQSRKLQHESITILKQTADTLKEIEVSHSRHEKETLQYHAEQRTAQKFQNQT